MSLTEDPGIEWLSEPEINLIEGVYDSYGALDQWGLRDLTHNLPEWSNPRGSRLSINHKDILLAEEFSEDEAEEIVEEISHHSRLKSVAR